jgi:hypothetical protein
MVASNRKAEGSGTLLGKDDIVNGESIFIFSAVADDVHDKALNVRQISGTFGRERARTWFVDVR